MKTETIQLSIDEQQAISGGINWGCFGAGALILGGAAGLQPEVVGAGIFLAAATCK